MKKSLLLTALLLAAATTASAQFAGGKSNGAHSSNTASTENWSRVFASYNNISFSEGDFSLNGVSVGYERGFNVSRNLPLFIKVSPQLTYGGGTMKESDSGSDEWGGGEWSEWSYGPYNEYGEYEDDSYGDEKPKMTYMAINVPVSVTYRWAVGNKLSIEPYAGVNFRINVIGKMKSGDFKMNFFKKDEVGDDLVWNRFQLGGQIGVGVNYSKLYAGIGYGFDFMELAKKTKLSTLSITLGFNF